MHTPLELEILAVTRAEVLANEMLKGDGKTVTDVRLEGEKPSTRLVVAIKDGRDIADDEWECRFPLWDGGWMQSDGADPEPGAVATIVFSNLLDS